MVVVYEISVYASNPELIMHHLTSPEDSALMSLDKMCVGTMIITANTKEDALRKAHEQYTSLNPSGLRSFAIMKIHSRKVAIAQSLENPPLFHIIYR